MNRRQYLNERIKQIWPKKVEKKEFFLSDAFKRFLTKIAKGLTKRDIDVLFSNTVATDNKHIYLDPVRVTNKVEDLIIAVICVMGCLCHEIAHIIYTAWSTVEKVRIEFKNEIDYERVFNLFNIIEDSAIEYRSKKKYRGLFRTSIRISNSQVFKRMNSLEKKTDDLDILITASMMYAICRQMKGDVPSHLTNVFKKAQRILDEGRIAESSDERYYFAKALYQLFLPYYKHNAKSPEYVKNKQMGSCGKGNQPEENKSSGSQSGKDYKNNENGTQENKNDEQTDKKTENKKNNSNNQKGNSSEQEKENDRNGMSLEEAFSKLETAVNTFKIQRVKEQKKTMDSFPLEKNKHIATDSDFKNHSFIKIKDIIPQDQAVLNLDKLSSEISLDCYLLKKLFKELIKQNENKKLTGYYEGKVNTRDLYRMYTDKKVFYQNKYKSKKSDLAILLMIDMSGSMFGERITNAAKAAIMMFETCLSLNIPIAIVGHEAKSRMPEVKHHWFVNFEEKSKDKLKFLYARENTREGLSIRILAKEFSRRKEKDKIMICISDGLSYHNSGRDIYYNEKTEKDIKEAVDYTKKFGIKTFGVAIGEDKSELQKIFKNYVDVQNTKDLPVILTNIIKKELFK